MELLVETIRTERQLIEELLARHTETPPATAETATSATPKD
jgi:hypothetical protein